MNNSNSSYRKKKITVLFILILLLSLAVFLYRDSRPVVFTEGIIQNIFSSPKSFMYSIGKNERDRTIKLLTERNRTLEEKLAQFEMIKKDNDALKSQFVTSGEVSQSLVAAKIIGFQHNNIYPTTIVIDVGLTENIKKGMPVVFGNNLVGRIEIVRESYSVVITPYNPAFRALAKISETNANGLLSGNSDFLILEGVVISDTIPKDGVVTTKGEVDRDGLGLYPDIIMGRVTTISRSDTAPFQSAQVKPIIDFSKLIDVFVISEM